MLRVRRVLRARRVLRVRRRWRCAAFRAARLTGASVAAYVVAEGFGLVDPPPLVAALTALLVVQATASSTLSSGVERVAAVVAGVAIAAGFSAVVGLCLRGALPHRHRLVQHPVGRPTPATPG